MPAFAAAVTDDAARGVDRYRRLLEATLRRPVGSSASDLLDAALERLAASDAYLVLVDLDDLVGETEPHNVPGQVLPTTWRRRLRAPTSEVLATRRGAPAAGAARPPRRRRRTAHAARTAQ